ncbi:hypothetical protein B0H17DRAFT_1124864 [Mycena rosella]|uniref:Uncharacterized protein n=1 Tax=Mycena rosella TaxID=1033263 RepID=A0AAD7MAC7_MYCRO|nr:hypothetical protein B0H17DRAFT_1124864 [Mycena rosella]
MSRVLPGTIAKPAALIEDTVMRLGLLNYYNRDAPTVHLPLANLQPGARTKMLDPHAETYNYATLDGRRIVPTTRSKGGSAKAALVQVDFKGETHVGELRVIFRHAQPGLPTSKDTLLAYINWLKRSDLTPLDDNKFIWKDL